MTTTESGVDLFIAEYDDPSIADRNWDQIKQLAKDDVIDVEGLLLLSRDASGKIKVKDDAHDVKKGVGVGAVAGASLFQMSRKIFHPASSCFQTTTYLPVSTAWLSLPTIVYRPVSHAQSAPPFSSAESMRISDTGNAITAPHIASMAARPSTSGAPGG